MTYSCAKQNPLTGLSEETFATPYEEQHKIGGRIKGRGLKWFGCFVGDSCQKWGKDKIYEPVQKYAAVSSKSEFCNFTQIEMHDVKRDEKLQTAFYDICMKSNHPNVLICPDKGYFKLGNETLRSDVNLLKQLEEKLEKNNNKGKRKKKKKRRRKKKKKGLRPRMKKGRKKRISNRNRRNRRRKKKWRKKGNGFRSKKVTPTPASSRLAVTKLNDPEVLLNKMMDPDEGWSNVIFH